MKTYEGNVASNGSAETRDGSLPVQVTGVGGGLNSTPGPDRPADAATKFNPFLMALWLVGAGLPLVSILTSAVAANADLGRGFFNSTTSAGMAFLHAIQPFAVPCLMLGLAAIIAVLILHAVRWDRQRST